MKIKAKRFLVYSLIMTLSMLPLYFTIPYIKIKNHKSEEISRKDSPQISTIYDTPIEINDLPGSLINWSWAKDQGYCTGSGTSSDPFIIKNHIFGTPTIPFVPLIIHNSLKHFVIKDCLFIGSGWPGILLSNVTNGKITGNSMAVNTGALIYMGNSSYNIISNNNASNGLVFGIILDASGGHTRNNTISHNIVSGNLDVGICLHPGCENNVISENIIKDNGNYGIALYSNTSNNQVYLNCLNNTSNALDDGINNYWDNGIKGNYWDDYPYDDEDADGIGDTPYNISGSAGNQDNYPLIECPERSVVSGMIPGYDIGILVSSLFILIIGAVYSTLKKKRNNHAL